MRKGTKAWKKAQRMENAKWLTSCYRGIDKKGTIDHAVSLVDHFIMRCRHVASMHGTPQPRGRFVSIYLRPANKYFHLECGIVGANYTANGDRTGLRIPYNRVQRKPFIALCNKLQNVLMGHRHVKAVSWWKDPENMAEIWIMSGCEICGENFMTYRDGRALCIECDTEIIEAARAKLKQTQKAIKEMKDGKTKSRQKLDHVA